MGVNGRITAPVLSDEDLDWKVRAKVFVNTQVGSLKYVTLIGYILLFFLLRSHIDCANIKYVQCQS